MQRIGSGEVCWPARASCWALEEERASSDAVEVEGVVCYGNEYIILPLVVIIYLNIIFSFKLSPYFPLKGHIHD